MLQAAQVDQKCEVEVSCLLSCLAEALLTWAFTLSEVPSWQLFLDIPFVIHCSFDTQNLHRLI